MEQRKIWKAEELERLTPDQRHKLINDSIVTNLDDLDPALVAKIRAEGRRIAEEHGFAEKLKD